MEADAASLLNQIAQFGAQAVGFAESLLTPGWRQYQVFIIIGLLALAQGLAWVLMPRLREQMRELEGWPKWRLRALLVLHRRTRLILFVILAWGTTWFMRETTWPSRSYLIGVVATLATAWLLVGLAARLVRNPFLRKVVTWVLWAYATIYILGLSGDVSAFLDDIAVTFGSFRISALVVFKALFVTGVLLTLARLTSQTTASRLRGNDDISPSMQVLVIKIVQTILYGSAFFIGLKAVGFDLTGLAVLSGAIGVGLGFGLQKVVSNLVSGVIILLDKSIKPGDVISLGDTFGWINALGARYVSVVTRDGKEYLIPNEDLITNQVVNWSHTNDFVRLDIFFGTSYHDDPHKVRELAVAAAASVGRVLKDRAPVCHIVGFGDSSVDYILRFWISDPSAGLTNVKGAVYLGLWDSFQEHGISIPFPQREVTLLNTSPQANDTVG